MKVRCIQIVDEDTGQIIQNSSWLTVGREYHVLSVLIEYGKPLEFQLIADDGTTPCYNQAIQFEVISNIIPPNWVAAWDPGVCFKLSPEKWLGKGYWEDYFNGVSEAISIFESEKEKIIKHDL